MPRGHYNRRPKLEVVEAPPARSFAQLVDAPPAPELQHVEPIHEPETVEFSGIEALSADLAIAIRSANRDGRFGDAAALNTVATVLGELTRAINALTDDQRAVLGAMAGI